MTGMQLWTVALAAVVMIVVMVRMDPMTHRTHRWPPMLRLMACGLAGAWGGWAGWVGEAVPVALALQFLALGDLAYTYQMGLHYWRPSKLRDQEAT